MFELPAHRFVPREPGRNLEWRIQAVRNGFESRSARRNLLELSRKDVLFWVNGFVWTYDPRPVISEYRGRDGEVRAFIPVHSGSFTDEKEVPFITFEAQEELFREVSGAIGRHDLGIDKSRDMGATWVILMCFLHRWLFGRLESFLLMSYKGDLVDQPDNPDCLFWKLRFAIERLPGWMRPELGEGDDTRMHLLNPVTKSVIDGVRTTGNMGRAGRRTAAYMDELAFFDVADGYRAWASTQQMTPSRICSSTPNGRTGCFAEVMHSAATPKFRLHWTQHPQKRRGLYKSSSGVLQVVDREYQFPEGYPFILDGKVRSPYYDLEDSRTPVKSLLAQEQDIDYLGSGHQFFDLAAIDRHSSEHGALYAHRGEMIFDDDPRLGEYQESNVGRLMLWCTLEGERHPQRDRRYCMGVDVSAGTGASNSVISIGDLKTSRKVGVFVTPGIRPEDLAAMAVALGWWFVDSEGETAFMIWESNGPGLAFGQRVIELGYSTVYYRKKEGTLSSKTGMAYGWHSDKETKIALLSEYNRALAAGQFINPDRDSLGECSHYVYSKTRSVEHTGALSSPDPSGAAENHGDRVLADALTWKAMREFRASASGRFGRTQAIPVGSLAWRRQRRKERREQFQETAMW